MSLEFDTDETRPAVKTTKTQTLSKKTVEGDTISVTFNGQTKSYTFQTGETGVFSVTLIIEGD